MDKQKKGSTECIRYGYILLNTLFLVFGIGMLFLGVWFYAVPANANVSTITMEPTEQTRNSLITLVVISVGTAVSVLSFIACCGALKQNKCFLSVIIVFIVILLALQVILTAIGVLLHEQIKAGVTDQMAKTLAYNYSGDDGQNSQSVAWTEMQKTFTCCGVNSTEGYRNHSEMIYENVTGSLWYRTQIGSLEYPDSCCSESKEGNKLGNISCHGSKGNLYLNEKGCATSVEDFLLEHMLTIVLMAACIVIIEFVIFICSCRLCKSIPKKTKKSNQVSDRDLKEKKHNRPDYEGIPMDDFAY